MICRQCGTNNWDQATICGSCGASLFAPPSQAADVWQPSPQPYVGPYQGQHLAGQVQRVAEPLYRAKGWMKFMGVLSIIYGVLLVVSISGILFAWLPIWMGVVLCSASNRISLAFETDNENEFHASMTKLATYFRVAGIATLVIMIIALLAGLVAIAFFATQRR